MKIWTRTSRWYINCVDIRRYTVGQRLCFISLSILRKPRPTIATVVQRIKKRKAEEVWKGSGARVDTLLRMRIRASHLPRSEKPQECFILVYGHSLSWPWNSMKQFVVTFAVTLSSSMTLGPWACKTQSSSTNRLGSSRRDV